MTSVTYRVPRKPRAIIRQYGVSALSHLLRDFVQPIPNTLEWRRNRFVKDIVVHGFPLRPLTVSGNWRLIFTYDENTNIADDIDLIDYH